jgi:leucyl-tRNA synthetase
MLYHVNVTLKGVTESFEKMEIRDALNKVANLVDLLKDYVETGATKKVYTTCVEAITLMLAPGVPHMAEEVWEVALKKKGFIAHAKWPAVDDSAITPAIKNTWDYDTYVGDDIQSILKILQKEPNKVTLIVAAEWKHAVAGAVVAGLKEGKNAGDVIKKLMADPAMKKLGGKVAGFVNKLAKDPWGTEKLPKFAAQADEVAAAGNFKLLSGKKYKTIEIVAEESSVEKKAEMAIPGRPAILIS